MRKRALTHIQICSTATRVACSLAHNNMRPEGVKHIADSIAKMPQLSTVKYMPPRFECAPHRLGGLVGSRAIPRFACLKPLTFKPIRKPFETALLVAPIRHTLCTRCPELKAPLLFPVSTATAASPANSTSKKRPFGATHLLREQLLNIWGSRQQSKGRRTTMVASRFNHLRASYCLQGLSQRRPFPI